MKSLKDKIGGIVILIVAIACCKQCTSEYIKGGDNKAISNYEKMIFDKSTAIAELYPEYKETTVKIAHVPIKTYEFRYHFEVDGNKYEGEHTFSTDLPKSNTLKIYYLKDDPNFNLQDPQAKLDSEKEKNTSNSSLYWAIGWGVFALLMLLGLIDEFKKKPQPQPETEIEPAE
ncbi:hypothetical protein [Flavobacterium sp. KACC 22761]|uniref:hypothetical protein n=1 Tax=Flavobacterium sp. KACC 22761 TaxID=3092665 RepID=UPI002A766A98|nr:hypothetical protein [Flavobacterium sp. KACC 22761]WPO80863.1 hypothetical protein SCB73_10820 [Flavobacterium sp. KACC 22761]